MVRRRAPCSFSAIPPSHCASVISNRSICGTAPAMLNRASIRPNAASAWSTTPCAAAGWPRSASMTSTSAPAAFTASAVCSRLVRLRATRTNAEKSRARRMAVAWPIPWLAPVTMATDFDMCLLLDLRRIGLVGPRRPQSRVELAGKEVADGGRDLGRVGLQREMAGVKEADHGVGDIAFERLGARRQEERIVPAPHCEERRPVVAEVLLEGRIERDVALVVAEQVELQLGHAGPGEIEIVQRIAVRRNRRWVRHAVRVLPDRGLGCEECLQRLAIGLGRILPVGPDRIPAVAEPFFVGIAVLRNDRGDPVRMLHRQAETGRRTVIEDIDGVAIETDHFGETIDDVSDPIEAMAAVGPVGIAKARQV